LICNYQNITEVAVACASHILSERNFETLEVGPNSVFITALHCVEREKSV